MIWCVRSWQLIHVARKFHKVSGFGSRAWRKDPEWPSQLLNPVIPSDLISDTGEVENNPSAGLQGL